MEMKDHLPSTGLQEMLDAGVHFGHQTKRWNPYMSKYIYGERKGIYVIDLGKSLVSLRIAQQFIYDIVVRGRNVLFVGTKKQAQDIVKETAEKFHQPYVIHRWLGGMLTNNQTIRLSVNRMHELQQIESEGGLEQVGSKKEGARLRRELTKLERNLSGIADMERMPSALFVVDVVREAIAVQEARRLGIPVIAIVDTNADPRIIDYPIPGNDDSIRAIQFLVGVIGETIQHASNEYAKLAAEEARRRAAADAEAAERKRQAEAERKTRQDAEKVKRDEAIKAAAAKLAEKQAAEAAVEAPAPEAPAEVEAPAAEAVETPAPAATEPEVAEAPAPEAAEEAPAAEAAPEAAEETAPEADKEKA